MNYVDKAMRAIPMLVRYVSGETCRQIGADYGISIRRVNDLIRWTLRFASHPSKGLVPQDRARLWLDSLRDLRKNADFWRGVASGLKQQLENEPPRERLQYWIGDFDDQRQGLIIATTQKEAADLVGEGIYRFRKRWLCEWQLRHKGASNGFAAPDDLKPRTIYTRPKGTTIPFAKGICDTLLET